MSTPTPPPQSPPLAISALGRYVLKDLVGILRPLLIFEVIFKALILVLGMAGAYLVLALISREVGTAAVTNTDIAAFALSPRGLLTVLLIGLATILAAILEHLGVMAIAARFGLGDAVTVGRVVGTLASTVPAVLRLKLIGLMYLALVALPFAILAALTYLMLLSRHDINYYLSVKPASFYVAMGVGALLLLGFLSIVAKLFVRSILIFPILLLEGRSVSAAGRESSARTAPHGLRIGVIMIGWQAVGMFLGAGVIALFARGSELALSVSVHRVWQFVAMVGLLVVLHALLLAAVSFVVIAVNGLIIVRIYRALSPDFAEAGGVTIRPALAMSPPAPAASGLPRGTWKLAALVLMAGFLAVCFVVAGRLNRATANVVVTAHRGYSRVAPENTLAAIRKAIEVGADYAEINVQETADGELIINHDSDLMRVAGDPRRIAETRLADLKTIDVGTHFSPEFAGERLPTLAEVIAVARGKIKLQIELKFHGKDRTLAGKVARLIEREKFEPECVVSSLNYDGLVEARKANPRLHTAAIVTYALGDINRLDVDALSVNARNLTNALIRAARRRNKEIYAWTVDEPREMVALIERGVSNIVTNVPDVLIGIRREFAGLGDLERRMLAARYLLGLDTGLEPSESTGTSDRTPADDEP